MAGPKEADTFHGMPTFRQAGLTEAESVRRDLNREVIGPSSVLSKSTFDCSHAGFVRTCQSLDYVAFLFLATIRPSFSWSTVLIRGKLVATMDL